MKKNNEVAVTNIRDPSRQAQQSEKAQNYWFENLPSTIMESGLLG